jgi:hypothetical protein
VAFRARREVASQRCVALVFAGDRAREARKATELLRRAGVDAHLVLAATLEGPPLLTLIVEPKGTKGALAGSVLTPIGS